MFDTLYVSHFIQTFSKLIVIQVDICFLKTDQCYKKQYVVYLYWVCGKYQKQCNPWGKSMSIKDLDRYYQIFLQNLEVI